MWTDALRQQAFNEFPNNYIDTAANATTIHRGNAYLHQAAGDQNMKPRLETFLQYMAETYAWLCHRSGQYNVPIIVRIGRRTRGNVTQAAGYFDLYLDEESNRLVYRTSNDVKPRPVGFDAAGAVNPATLPTSFLKRLNNAARIQGGDAFYPATDPYEG